MAEVSIIIATYNSISTIRYCLDSIRKQLFRDLEVFVIDNNSKDGTKDFLMANYPEIKLIENKENLGFSKANNIGIGISKARYIITLNPDARLERDFISNILEFLNKESDNRVGMISGKILRDDGIIIDSTGLVLTRFRRFFDRGSRERDNGKYNKRERVFGPCAAAAFYRRGMLEDLKVNDEYFDEDFFCFVEDVDLAWRANKKGWICYYLPEARCYHHRNSSNCKRPLRQYYAFRNRYLMMIKNDNLRPFHILSVIFYDIPRFFYLLFTNAATIKALISVLLSANLMLFKRRGA